MKTFFKNIGNTIVKKLRKHPLICNFVLSVVLAFVLEVLGRQTFDLSAVGFVDQRSKMFLYSIFIIFVTYSVTLITKRRLFSYIIVTLLWSIVGIVNFMMLSSRNTPFTYVDITLMKSVLPVMNNYFSPLEIGAMGALLLIALVLLVVAYMYLPIEEHLNRKSGFIKVIVIIAVFSGVTSYGFKSGMLVDQIHNIRIAFSDYGTPYCFSITALKNGIDKPSDYSEKKIKKIEKRTQKKVAKMKKEKVKKPNIIFVQLESHFDITQVKGVKFNKDPLPNFHKYMKGYSSGQLSMPSYGAGTANSEFELITGMNLDHFGAAEYPYKTVLQNTTTESMATVLKNYGYKAHAIHDNSAAFYDRDLVFSQLGFDTFTTKELKKYASSTKTCDTFMNSYTKWKNKVMEDGKKEKFFDNLKGKYVWGIIMLIIAILIDFVGSFTFHVDFSLLHLLIPLALIFLIYTCFIKRKSKKGIEHYAKWKAFKNFLNDFGSFSTKELPEVILWERYLVYATIFGLAKKVQKDMNVKILLETMSGKGTELGTNFDDLKYIIDNIEYSKNVGICLDTCHLNDAGYDIFKFDEILDEVDSKIGLEKVIIHANSSETYILEWRWYDDGSHNEQDTNAGINGSVYVINIKLTSELTTGNTEE